MNDESESQQIRRIEMENDQRSNSVIPSEVEESLIDHQECLQPSHEATAWQATSLDMTLH